MRWPDLTKKPLRCCDIWDTDYNTDNWEPEFMTIFAIWQLIVTLDSIHNSCDVSSVYDLKLVGILDQFRLNFSVWPTNKKFRVHPTAPLKKIHLVVRQNNKRPQSCRFYVLFVPMINSGGIKDTGGLCHKQIMLSQAFGLIQENHWYIIW